MKATLGAASLLRGDRRERARNAPDRREGTPFDCWLRQYGPLVGLALMGLSAAAVVAFFYAGLWTLGPRVG